ncbi:MAG: homoserine dehydrogenase [Candidatus Marinimicrobia bacterium]|nr:homoserine dehydrogenase [Candidatus Neomarinimicrobiota bacterium]
MALIGFGTVAQGLCQILHDKRAELFAEYDFDFEIIAVTTRSRGTMYHPQGLSLSYLLELAATTDPFSDHLINWDAEDMIRNSNATIIVELAHSDLQSGEPAITHCRTALGTKKHVICGNKGPATLAYNELKSLSAKEGLHFLNEATVLSGTPVFSLMQKTLAGNKVLRIRGILNGATNFMLSEMESGSEYEQAIEAAMAKGYLEADRTADVEGYDAQAKLTILANILMDHPLQVKDVQCRGISKLRPHDILAAKAENKRWKLVATLERERQNIHAEVKPEKLSLSDPLAQIMGTANSITISTDLLGDVTITGPGAGKIETGYAILSDLLTINRGESS